MSITDIDSHGRSRGPSSESLSLSLQDVLNTPLVPLVGLMALFLAAFGNLVNVAIDKDTVALDQQVVFKLLVLAVGGVYGAYGFVCDSRIRRLVLTLPCIWVVIIIGFYFLAVPGSVMPAESLGAAISMTCVLLMTVACLVQFGAQSVLNTVFHAISAFVVLSWVAIVAFPQIGVFAEPLGDGDFQIRLSGLAHPNTLGQFSGLLIVITCLLWTHLGLRSKWRLLILMLAVAALIGSLSRTSLLATMAGLLFVYRQRILKPENFVYFVWLALLGSVTMLAMVFTGDLGEVILQKLSLLSKSGDTAELTSATGRVEIWAYVISMIRDQPLTGYGAATSKLYLAEYSLYAHNMVLNIAFSSGICGGLAAICMCLGRVRELVFRPHRLADGLLVFILVNGLFENVIFSNLSGMPTIIWIVAITLPGLDAINRCASERSMGTENGTGNGDESNGGTRG